MGGMGRRKGPGSRQGKPLRVAHHANRMVSQRLGLCFASCDQRVSQIWTTIHIATGCMVENHHNATKEVDFEYWSCILNVERAILHLMMLNIEKNR